MRREEDFRAVIAQWVDFTLPELLSRDIEVPLDGDLIITIVGGRRTGKTYLIFQLIKHLLLNLDKRNVLYVNFEHERLRYLDARDLEDLLKVYYELMLPDDKKPIFLFLDEIQNVSDWELWVRRVFDQRKFRLFLSGSSSKLLAKEIATSLRGRALSRIVTPFSFQEFLTANGVKIREEKLELLQHLEERGKIIGYLDEYMKFGGYPEVVLQAENRIKEELLLSYFQAIFYRDLVERYSIRNAKALDFFLKYALANFSKYASVSKSYNYLKSLGVQVSKRTLLNLQKFAEDVFFLFFVEIYSYGIKRREQYPKKVYCIDPGILNVFTPRFSDNFGRLMENLVFIDLKRRQFERQLVEVYYFKSNDKETDFVLKEGVDVKQLIQVTYASDLEEIERREFDGIIKACMELKCDNLLIITWDYGGEEVYKGHRIQFVPLWLWLLGDL